MMTAQRRLMEAMRLLLGVKEEGEVLQRIKDFAAGVARFTDEGQEAYLAAARERSAVLQIMGDAARNGGGVSEAHALRVYRQQQADEGRSSA